MAHIKRNQKATSLTINEAHDLYIEEKMAMNLAEPTLTTYHFVYARFLEVMEITGDETFIEDITQRDIYHFIGRLKETDISLHSINGYITTLRAFFYWCMDEARGYMEPFKIPSVKYQENTVKFFDDEDVMRLLAKPNAGDTFGEWRMWAVVNWILGTANRVKTCCNVKMKDLDFKNREITIESQKNKKAQIIPMSSALEASLREYIRMWRYDAKPEEYLFCSISEGQISARGMSQSFARYCANRGVEKTSIHGLRHTYARCFIRNGGNPLVLQKMLNHSTLEMTKRYVALFSADMRDEINMYNPLDVIKKKTSRTQSVKRR